MNWPRSILAGALAASLAMYPAYGKDEPIVLEPSSKWELDYSNDSCALRRMFSDGEKRVQVEMRRFSPGSSMQVSVLSDGWKMARQQFRYEPVEFRFEPAVAWRNAQSVLFARFGKEFEGVIFSSQIVPSPIEEGREAKEDDRPELSPAEIAARDTKAWAEATAFTIKGAFKDVLTLNTGSMLASHFAMSGCIDELLTHWGIDVAAHRTLSRPAKPQDMDALVKRVVGDYPMKMLARGMNGIVRVRLSVDSAGNVSQCHIQLEIADPEFEKSACEQMSPSKFEPALDKDGNPIASYWVTTVIYRWAHRRPPPNPPAAPATPRAI